MSSVVLAPYISVRSVHCVRKGVGMAMMLVLIGDAGPVDVTADRISELGRLGVTEVSVLRDATTVGVVLHGWAFDPQRSADEAAALVTAGRVSRRLLPVLHATVLPGD